MEIGLLVSDPIVTATGTTADTISFDQLRFTWAALLRVYFGFFEMIAPRFEVTATLFIKALTWLTVTFCEFCEL